MPGIAHMGNIRSTDMHCHAERPVLVQYTDSWDRQEKVGTVESQQMAALLVAAVVPLVDKVDIQAESAVRPLGAGSVSLRHVPDSSVPGNILVH